MELSRQEQSMAESRRERDKVLADYRRQAEEKREFKEKVERRVSLFSNPVLTISTTHSCIEQLRKTSTHHSAGQSKPFL